MSELLPYFTVRTTTAYLYVTEWVITICTLIWVLARYLRDPKSRDLSVFVLVGVGHSVLECSAALRHTRDIPPVYIGDLLLPFPIPSIGVGFFEGGFIGLMAYHFMRWRIGADLYSRKVFATGCLLVIFVYAAGWWTILPYLSSHPELLIVTRREIFKSTSVLLLLVFILVPTITAFRSPKGSPRRRIYAAWYLGLLVFSAVVILPLLFADYRVIQASENGHFRDLNPIEFVLVSLVYNLGVEAAGFLFIYVVLLDYLGLLPIPAEQDERSRAVG